MLPTDARILLLTQHDRLRSLLKQVVEAAHQLLADKPALLAFRRALAELRIALKTHNQSEEGILEPLLQRGDELGPDRVRRMLEEHVAEHVAMGELLSGTDRDVASRIDDFAEDLLAHIDAEERTFLHRAVLKDAPAHK